MIVSKSLRTWFLIHFIVDSIVAVPLFLFPVETLTLLGWTNIDPIATRLVAAALFGIGGISFVAVKAEVATYKHLLLLKIIWSITAIIGIFLSIIQYNTSKSSIFVILIFAFFSCIWVRYYFKLKNL